jgi:hypothetical protein
MRRAPAIHLLLEIVRVRRYRATQKSGAQTVAVAEKRRFSAFWAKKKRTQRRRAAEKRKIYRRAMRANSNGHRRDAGPRRRTPRLCVSA